MIRFRGSHSQALCMANSPNYQPHIDGLRAIAVLAVVFYHYGLDSFGGGFVGVDVFFVISGYLITTIIKNDIESGTFSFARFYERRARRILPALMFVMAVCIPLAWLTMMSFDMHDFGQSLVAVSLFLSNALFWFESGYFDQIAELKPLLHTWSLAIEEQFYVLFPVILIILMGIGTGRTVMVLSVLLLVSLMAAEWGSFNAPTASFFFLPTRGWELLIGSLAAFQFGSPGKYQLSSAARNRLNTMGLALILVSIFWFDEHTRSPGLTTLMPTLGAVLIILFARRESFVGALLTFRPVVFVGLISYSSYLWHQPIFAFVRISVLETPSQFVMVLLSTLSIGLGFLSWKFVETPFRHGRQISNRVFVPSVLLATMLFISFGYYVHTVKGQLPFMNKFDQVIKNTVKNRTQPFGFVLTIMPWGCLDHIGRLGQFHLDGVDAGVGLAVMAGGPATFKAAIEHCFKTGSSTNL